MSNIHFIDSKGDFYIDSPDHYNYLFLPIANELGIKSCLTPTLGGDSKLDQNSFLLEPVSVENLHNNKSTRNFWCITDKGIWSVTGQSAKAEAEKFTDKEEPLNLIGGFMWQMISKTSKENGLETRVYNFVPHDCAVEIMHVQICNTGKTSKEITPVAAIPMYARSADNLRDHRHVTSLLHRIKTTKNGVYVHPTLSFDERGHSKNMLTYFVCGITGDGKDPVSFYPIVEDYIGEGGSFVNPRALLEDLEGVPSGEKFEGKEALGGIRFAKKKLKPGEKCSYTIVMGTTLNERRIPTVLKKYKTEKDVHEALKATDEYWQERVNVNFETGSKEFDGFMRWVSFQPILRRIFGCSFLPYHDYGKGGRGWRDLWQDCLALLIMDPKDVRSMILDNFAGVRIDGTNATIIGEKQGEFVADRNGITRVWMDHGMWPLLTVKLYIDQTGDIEVLNEQVTYFKDAVAKRGTAVDTSWKSNEGSFQLDNSGKIYKGTVLEHILIQHLFAYLDMGEHGYMRLRGADWNDAIDMAADRGESVAFSSAYAGNLKDLANLIRELSKKTGTKGVMVFEDIENILNQSEDQFEKSASARRLMAAYLTKNIHRITGKRVEMDYERLANSLERLADLMMERIRSNEWIDDGNDGWFNSYYDNSGNAVETSAKDNVRMMLTGQVFTVMSKTADCEAVSKICKSADKYLYDENAGGYRLNTNFHEEKYDMGRMFGFAYGEKENGAVFSHMTVMYANALYQRGFAHEGYKALETLSRTAMDFDVSKNYPGIPEYFNAKGRGMYQYLTGAASWYMLTMVTRVFGVRGEMGALRLDPMLVKDQFDKDGKAQISLYYAGKKITVVYLNKQKLDYGNYCIESVYINGINEASKGLVSREILENYEEDITITVTLKEKN